MMVCCVHFTIMCEMRNFSMILHFAVVVEEEEEAEEGKLEFEK